MKIKLLIILLALFTCSSLMMSVSAQDLDDDYQDNPAVSPFDDSMEPDDFDYEDDMDDDDSDNTGIDEIDMDQDDNLEEDSDMDLDE
jgi:hypothetical protein